MDNLTHTLTGFALAESGLKRTTRLGVAALVIGANLPDVDGLVYLGGRGVNGLWFRRGWTHGVLAMVVLPLLLTGVLLLLDRRRGGAGPNAVRPRQLLLLAAIGVWSHPLLDLLNVYGVRLLMPFSHRWFYGDALFIIDPWVLAVLVAGILLARVTRLRERAARLALVVFAVYAALMAFGSWRAESLIQKTVTNRRSYRTLAAPAYGNPLEREILRDLGGTYEVGDLTLGIHMRYTPVAAVGSAGNTAAAELAARTSDGIKFLSWARFPVYELVPGGDSMFVIIKDLRYARTPKPTWASVTVTVPSNSTR